MAQKYQLIPSLAALRCFEAAARHQSFTMAAEELQVTQSAVSRNIRELEVQLETALFRRTGRRVVTTEAGTRLANQIAVNLDSLKQTILKTIAGAKSRRSIRIASVPAFSERWLVPRLGQLEAILPSVEISVSTFKEPFDLATSGFDLAIHFGLDNWPDTKMVRLCNEEIYAVCAPGLRLGNATYLHLESRPDGWAEWYRRSAQPSPDTFAGKYFDQHGMVIAAARAGLGVALLPEYLIEKELESGELQRASDEVWKTKRSYFAVTRAGENDPQVNQLIAWLKKETTRSRRARKMSKISS